MSIEDTNSIINKMIEEVHEANDIATNMAAITEEQSASAESIENMAVNIQELTDEVTTNSSNVKSGAEELAIKAEELKKRVSGFNI